MADQKPQKPKKNTIDKVTGVLFEKDAREIAHWLLYEKGIPLVKKTVLDVIFGALDGLKGAASMFIYGNSAAATPSSDAKGGVSYDKCYDQGTKQETQRDNRLGFRVIPFPTREVAEDKLKQLREILTRYSHVTVSDYYEVSDGSLGGYAASNYGWKDLSGVEILVTSDGKFILDLPKAVPIRG